MAIALFLALALVCAAIIAYPLFSRRAAADVSSAPTRGDIDRAVRRLRRSRARGEHVCASCGRSYQPGDRFCVGCGAGLPQPATPPTGPACAACGAALQAGDQFCAKCGHGMVGGEVG